jgi:hypothetical protein
MNSAPTSRVGTASMDNLTDDQRQALNQLRTLTDGADDEVSVNVLSSVDWDVQVGTPFNLHSTLADARGRWLLS